ncbi:olfactory receptor 5V1-like [Rhinophrynus dorsalis]
MNNYSNVKEFILLGFPPSPSVQITLFSLFFVFYVSTLIGNVFIITTTTGSAQLHTPMYFFLGNLSFLEILFTSVTIPKMLDNFLLKNSTISFTACAAQMYFFIVFGSIECTLLAVMAYDRYVAICNPLQYVIVMDRVACISLAASSWISGFFNSTVKTFFVFRLPFCSSNTINQFFCDSPPLMKLACGNTSISEAVLLLFGGIFGLGALLATLVSYIHIISTILKIRSKAGQRKAFSTCASHLIVVTMFYGSSISMYFKNPNSKYSLNQEKLTPVFYSVITPTLNPIVYTLRNEEFKRSLRKMIGIKLELQILR